MVRCSGGTGPACDSENGAFNTPGDWLRKGEAHSLDVMAAEIEHHGLLL
jgi:hypothetical protein